MPNKQSKSKERRYKTTNIDEATFLALKGHVPISRGVGERAAMFSFPTSGQFNEHLKMFWSKSAQINLHSWLAVRQTLKNLTSSQQLVHLATTDHAKFGQSYYYLEGGTVQHAIYGKPKVHEERYKNGNFYLKKEDAIKAKTITP